MSALVTVAACVRRDWRIALSYRLAYAIEVAAMVFTLLLFYYLARIVDSSSLPSSAGLDRGYFGFAVFGIALSRTLYVALTSFANQLREEQTTGTFEALMATPARPSMLILSSGTYDLLRGTLTGVLTIVAAVVFFNLPLEGGVESAAVGTGGLLGCIVLFAAMGVATAAFTVVFKQASAVLGLATTAIALIGGVYFPVQVLPSALEFIANILPFTWGLDVLRSALLQGDAEPGRLGLLLAFDIVALPAALVLFNAALRRARRAGSLAQY
ncbi:MAG TPA: ABC transporter permease [Thermoleophilaceae bacterium]|jgi:ABC-2 type transport system permease protein